MANLQLGEPASGLPIGVADAICAGPAPFPAISRGAAGFGRPTRHFAAFTGCCITGPHLA
jgi:hypothetical protein